MLLLWLLLGNIESLRTYLLISLEPVLHNSSNAFDFCGAMSFSLVDNCIYVITLASMGEAFKLQRYTNGISHEFSQSYVLKHGAFQMRYAAGGLKFPEPALFVQIRDRHSGKR